MVKTYLINQAGINESYFQEVKNNSQNLSNPIEILINKVSKTQAYFGDNPVTMDQMLNFVPQFNMNGQIYFTKNKQENRIDIFATIIMGISQLDLIREIGKKSSFEFEAWTL
jgi:phage terminase large subunit-like protein